jgi:hypothetical protein
MSEDIENSNLEDNLPLVNYIMLSRIYDVLCLIASKVCGDEEISKMVQYHEEGYLLGPLPSYNPVKDEQNG